MCESTTGAHSTNMRAPPRTTVQVYNPQPHMNACRRLKRQGVQLQRDDVAIVERPTIMILVQVHAMLGAHTEAPDANEDRVRLRKDNRREADQGIANRTLNFPVAPRNVAMTERGELVFVPAAHI
jgi:hypothetical protein